MRFDAEAMQSGGGWDTRVDADREDARKARAQHERHAALTRLVLAGAEAGDARLAADGANAETMARALWTKPAASADDHNDLGCAFAWLEQWDQARAALATSRERAAGDTPRVDRATRNLGVVEDARKAG
jgi:hypothetical protein